MKLLRNSELRRSVCITAAFTAVFALTALFINSLCAVLVLLTGAAAIAVVLASGAARYRKIERLTMDIDRVMHGDNSVNIRESKEGELFVLQNEIRKMLLCLREQNEQLNKSRVFLADSIADISHQLRTPLTSINLVLSLLSDPCLESGKRARLLKELSRLISKTDSLVTALLKISKIDAGAVEFDKSEIFVGELIRKAAEPLEIQLELKEQTLLTDIHGETVTGDLAWLSEAVGNILKNCMEHTPAGGTISVKANCTPIFTQIIIKDSGSGFDENDLPHIFERFYKGKNSSDMSFGIGLALAQLIVTSHGGVIRAKNSESGGAEFDVRFYPALPD